MSRQPRMESGPRAAFLDIVLRTLFVLAIVTAVPSIALAIAQDRYGVVAVDAGALALLAVLRYHPHLTYRMRAVGITVLPYAVGTWFLFEIGWVSHVYLLAVPVIAALLLGLRPALVALVVVTATLAIAGLGFDEGPYLTEDTLLHPDDERSSLAWLVVLGNFFFIAATLSVSCAALFDRFERSLEQNERSRRELATVVHAFDQIGEVVIVTDASGSITYANTALAGLAEGMRSSEEPRTVRDIPLTAVGGARLDEVVLAGAAWTGDLVLDTADETRTYQASVSPVSGTHGEADVDARRPRAVTVLQDVTAARSLEERMAQGERLEALGALAGGVAHDLRNIVAGVLAVAEAARIDAGSSGDARLQSDLTAIAAACQQAGEILRQLMSLGQRIAPERTSRPLSASIVELETILRAVLGASIPLDLRLDADDPVLVSPTEVNQLLSNLVLNARDAIRPRPGRVWISLNTDPTPPLDDPLHTTAGIGRPHLVLKVGDTGSGIPPEELDRIFDPFFTTKSSGEGTGLGLPSVHALVTSLGGTIEVASVVGHGTEFTIRLPVAEHPSTEPDPDLGAIGSPPAPPKGPGPHARILLVDDESLLLSMCAGSLRRARYEVVTAATGAEALTRLAVDPAIDLLVTDLSLPDVSGFEVLYTCRRSRPDLPAIVISGSFLGRPDAPELPRDVGVLEKPFTVAELVDAVRRALHRSHASDDLVEDPQVAALEAPAKRSPSM